MKRGKNKGGRPPLPPGRKMTERILFVARPEDRMAYDAAAADDKKPLSEWIRDVLNEASKAFRR